MATGGHGGATGDPAVARADDEDALAGEMDAEFHEGLAEHSTVRRRIPEPVQGDPTSPDDEEPSAREEATGGIRTPDREADPARGQRDYWRAEALIETERSHFESARRHDDVAGQRAASYRLAAFHGRTQSILRSALARGSDGLARAAIDNLGELALAMHQMHQASPHAVPVATVLDAKGRDLIARDLVVRTLAESPAPLDLDAVHGRANDLGLLPVKRGTVERHLNRLVETGHVQRTGDRPERHRRTRRNYVEVDLDSQGLAALLPDDVLGSVRKAGFNGLSDVVQQPEAFAETFGHAAGVRPETAARFTRLAELIVADSSADLAAWHHFDLLASAYPRPYQRRAYDSMRSHGYRATLIEAPTGSGKTLIGMMCIQDWLRTMRQGQSILILVPTTAYLQQWTGELCYKDIGLHLSPESVFSGTPAQLEAFQRRTGSHPAVLLMTYASLAQTGSAVGKGGFDASSIEMFLQDANIQHVVLDEVHKVVEDTASVSHSVAGLMVEWLEDGSLQGLVGFSGTAAAYRSRFDRLRLQLVASIPMDVLVAAGYVAPFTELGVPFSNSRRERTVRDLLDAYKGMLADYLAELGPQKLRKWFARIDLDRRVELGHGILGMYRGRSDWRVALAERLRGWESGGDLKLTELNLVVLVMLADGRSDSDLAEAAGMPTERFEQIAGRFDELRSQLAELIYLPQTLRRLAAPGFGRRFDVAALQSAHAEATNNAARTAAVKDHLAGTFAGLYEGLADWYRRVGEGRVEAIKAIIDAEREVRHVSGIIVFDVARRIDWGHGVAAPGYEGVGGLYAQMIGDPRFTPYAVLSGEQYLPHSDKKPLPQQVARFIESQIMAKEVSRAMFDLATQGLALPQHTRDDLAAVWRGYVDAYLPRLRKVRTARPSDFTARVVRPMRTAIAGRDLGAAGDRMSARLDLRNVHFAGLVRTFFDYAIIARYFRFPRTAELEQVSGAVQKFFVVPMPGGPRRQLMYDLTARLVDAPDLPFDLVIVSTWARTGWNVIAPNVLIDATATRDVTAWQQLRGRAIRARRTWTNDCYRLLLVLLGPWLAGTDQLQDPPVANAERPRSAAGPEDSAGTTDAAANWESAGVLDPELRSLLEEIAPAQLRRAAAGNLDDLSREDRTALALALVERRNKVTHIYEMVRSTRSGSQVEFDRTAGAWRRKEPVARKHDRELAVDIVSGTKSTGAGHAPLVYGNDPRSDLPEELREELERLLPGGDDRVARGWMGI